VVDKLQGLDVEELIFITGHLKEQVEHYVRSNYKQPARFIEQKVAGWHRGRGESRAAVRQRTGDDQFRRHGVRRRSHHRESRHRDGIIWAKEVDDYQASAWW